MVSVKKSVDERENYALDLNPNPRFASTMFYHLHHQDNHTLALCSYLQVNYVKRSSFNFLTHLEFSS